MFADDIALVSNSFPYYIYPYFLIEGLQKSMDAVHEYFDTWELKVNVDQSAFMVFWC